MAAMKKIALLAALSASGYMAAMMADDMSMSMDMDMDMDLDMTTTTHAMSEETGAASGMAMSAADAECTMDPMDEEVRI